MGTEFSSGKVVMFLRVIIEMMSVMAMEKCFGLMGQSIKANGEREFNMALARCFFLMVQLRKACLKTIHIKDLLSLLVLL
jgi:hypothetical protein